MATDEYGVCKKHNVRYLRQYGCTQCNLESHKPQMRRITKVSTYGNGASGENKVKQGTK